MANQVVAVEPVAEAGKGIGRLAVRVASLLGLGAAGLLAGALPLWAARKLVYPITGEPLNYSSDPVIDVTMLPERVEFASRDGKRLGGWFVPGPDNVPAPWPCILLVYGYGGYKEQMHGYAKMLHEVGYATLMFDMRGSGLRRGEPVTLGYLERWDLMDAVAYVRSRPDVSAEQLGVLGVSMGAATAIMAAEHDPNIKAIVADSSYADLNDMIRPGLHTFIGRAAVYFAPLIVRYAETIIGVRAGEVRPETAIAQAGERPILIIHGCNDELTTPKSAQRLYDAAPGPKELWMVSECGHGNAPAVAAEEYRRRVSEFFHRYLVAPAAV